MEESLADEKGTVRTAQDKPQALASKVLYGGGKLTPREARLLAPSSETSPRTRKAKRPRT